jgi:hypothetical protein
VELKARDGGANEIRTKMKRLVELSHHIEHLFTLYEKQMTSLMALVIGGVIGGQD